ncbi:glycoside hydrolase family 3 C-terminal domain-containing protein [Fusibacter bizertensis]
MPLKYKSIISQMTLVEKASLLSGEDFWHSRKIERLNVPAMALADGPHGLRKQASEGDHLGLVKGVAATCFPTSATMANSWDIAICEEVGKALGKEAVYNEVNIILGPGLNIKRSPLCGRNFEYYSEDPYQAGKIAAAFTRGIQSEGVGACLKHFAANNQEYLRMTNDSIVDERTLHEIYLTGFEIAVKEGKPKAVMSSYNKVNGTYSHEHRYLLRELLVDNWGFDGMVVSDWGGSNDAVESVKAGAHLEMPSTGYDSVHQIVDAVKIGYLEESVLDERVDEFLKVLYETEIKRQTELDFDVNHRLAQKAVEASIILLKNKSLLPLKPETEVAIIGDFADVPRYQGSGSSMVNPYKLDSTLELMAQSGLNIIGYAQGYDRVGKGDHEKLEAAVKLAQKAKVAVVYIGLNEIDEVEGQDRSHLKISTCQIELLAAISKVAKTVAVISGGSVIEMPWETHCDAIVHGYLTGQAGAQAIFNVLNGSVNPSGKLSETYPICYEDVPNIKYYPGNEKTSEYRDGIYVGYRYYDKVDQKVQYPFGFGLSYTHFEYSNLVVTRDGVKFNLKNIGALAGAEVSQLYIGKEQESIYRAKKELKGFKKVFLEPGETTVVEIPFDAYSFRYYDVNESTFQVERGLYRIEIGSSSRDIKLCDEIEIAGIIPVKDDSKALEAYFRGNITEIDSSTFQALYGDVVPSATWDKTQPLGLNDSLAQMVYAKSFLARFAINRLIGMRNKSVKKGNPDLNLFFLSNMPFRAIAKMSNGMISIAMTKNILDIVNGHFFKGLGGLVRSFISYRKRGLN